MSMAHAFLLGYPDPGGWAAQVTHTCCVIHAVYIPSGSPTLTPSARPALPAAAMEQPDPSHQQWLSKLKLRLPRHIRNDSLQDTPLVQCQSWPLPTRWYEAHKEEIKRWKENAPHTMEETMRVVRRDLATVPPLFAPARYTTIVAGRPVQVELYNLIPFRP